jgi:thiamine kinase-like enzyme
VRIPGQATELLAVDRRNERRNAEAAAETGVAPRVLEYVEDLKVMVLEFVEGETMSAEKLRSKEMAGRMATSVRRLHSARRFLADFDMFRLTEFYLRVCEERDVRIPEGFRDRMPQVAEIERAFERRPMSQVPCHNDLLAENYIDDGRTLWIVDFEYSGNNDPCFELGDTAQECGFDADLRASLCEAYFGRATDALLARVDLHAVMADVGWTLWAAIQAQISAIDYDFWGWAIERWERAVATFDGPGFGALLAGAGAD